MPEKADRFLVRDGAKSRLWEVTKAARMAHMYITSDGIIVTVWKRNKVSGKTNLVASKVFSFREFTLEDVGDTPEYINAFKIHSKDEMLCYRCEFQEEKTKIFSDIGKYQNLNPTNISDEMFANLENDKIEEIDVLSENVMKWLAEIPDEMDVLIAHRDFDAAVAYVEQARDALGEVRNPSLSLQSIRKQIMDRSYALSRHVSLELASPVATKNNVQNSIERLLRLKMGSRARDIFLTARSHAIRHRIRQISLSGSMVLYISELAEVIFRLIGSTCDWYSSSFKDTTMASGFMKWVFQEVDFFANIVRRQVFDSKQNFTIIAECMQSTLEYCKQVVTTLINI